MKKLMFLAISILTITSLVNCGNSNHNSSSSSDVISSESSSNSSSSTKLYTYKEVGKKTDTSLTVYFYVNIPGDEGLYRLHYVEPGNKIDSFNCVVRNYYGSEWYYDRYGTQKFDFDTPITEDLSLYAYPRSKMFDPEITEVEEIGEFGLTWLNSPNCSFEGVDESLPHLANSGDVIKFKISYSLTALSVAEVKIDGKTVTPDQNGVYTLIVSGEHVIETGVVNVQEDPNTPTPPPDGAPTSGYALYITSSNGEISFVTLTQTDPFGDATQYFADDVNLSVGDTIKLYDGNNGVSWIEDNLEKYGQYEKFTIKSTGIVCNEEGIYDFYVKFVYENDSIYIGNSQGQ